ncbi:MAG: hypothetical protein ACRCW1_09655 [Anaerotignaceae bacterium]
MSIMIKATQIWKIINGVTGMSIDNVEIRGITPKPLNKGDGFYVFVNLPEGQNSCKVISKGYQEKKVDFFVTADSQQPQILMLQPEEALLHKNYTVFSFKFVSALNPVSTTTVKYGYVKRSFERRIIEDVQKGSTIIPMEISSKNPLDYRTIYIEEQNKIYNVLSYNYTNKGYNLNSPIDKNIEAGCCAVELNQGITDHAGKMNLIFPAECFGREDTMEVVLYIDNKIIIVEVNKEYKNYNVKVGRRGV